MPTTTYPSDNPDDIPWEENIQQCMLQRCTTLFLKLNKVLGSLYLPIESHKSLKIVLRFVSTFIDIYKNLGPTTDGFIGMMRCRKETVIGPNKWVEVSRRVTKAHSKSMFNFKQGPKIKMLGVQYFKHHETTHHLYDRFVQVY